MAIDLSGLSLTLDGEGDPAALQRRAGARLAATEAWLDQDGEAVNRIAADHRDLAPDLDLLRQDLELRRGTTADDARHGETRAAIGGTLGRLAAGAAESSDPERRWRHGALARLALQDHAEAGLIGSDEAAALAGGYDAQLAAADADRVARMDPALARRLLADRSLFPGLAPGQRDRLARSAEARLATAGDDEAASAERAEAARAAGTLTETARNRADLGRRLTAGEAGLADIAAAEAVGEIDARGAGALRQRFSAQREKAKKDVEGIAEVEARLIAGGRLDPASAEDRAALNAHYLNTRKGWDEAGLGPEEVRAELGDYILDAGCIPDEVCRRIGRIFRVGSPEERWEAAEVIRTVEEKNPGLLGQLDQDDVKDALGIAALEKAGWPPVDAVARYELLASGEAKDAAAERDRAMIQKAVPEERTAADDAGIGILPMSTLPIRALDPKETLSLGRLFAEVSEFFKGQKSDHRLDGDLALDPTPSPGPSLAPQQQPSSPAPVRSPPLAPAAAMRSAAAIAGLGSDSALAPVFWALGAILAGYAGWQTLTSSPPSDGDNKAKNNAADNSSDSSPDKSTRSVNGEDPKGNLAIGQPQDEQDGSSSSSAPGDRVDSEEQRLLRQRPDVRQKFADDAISPKLEPIVAEGHGANDAEAQPFRQTFGEAIEDAIVGAKKWKADRIDDNRGSQLTVGDNKTLARVCREVLKEKYPHIEGLVRHVGGTFEDGGDRYLKELRIDMEGKEDAASVWRSADYSAKGPHGLGHIQTVTEKADLTPTLREARAIKDIDEIAKEIVEAVGKRRKRESAEAYAGRAREGCERLYSRMLQ